MPPDQTGSPVPAGRPLPLGWRLLEAWFGRLYGMRPLNDEPGCLIAYNLFTHRGAPVALEDGVVVAAGDRVMEVHFRREALLPLMADGDPRRMGTALLRMGDRDVPRLVRRLETDPDLREVRAIHALTLFHRGIERYGFQVMPVRGRLAAWWFTAWHRLLMARDHHEGARRVRRHRDKLVTRHIWVSRAELIRRYGQSG